MVLGETESGLSCISWFCVPGYSYTVPRFQLLPLGSHSQVLVTSLGQLTQLPVKRLCLEISQVSPVLSTVSSSPSLPLPPLPEHPELFFKK